ncbi:hypothetical protein [Bacillus sp. B15-48]|uniref:hypothetical protein n=1 Tax=Bacillus sp. B15-48 TaxID=1548601 RepID=UPI00193F3E67|nr:hypothetical protein [Bacillus sp. B15-48]MBM4762630.1 hypothetical protein [Bacillus sp. B15-48]
MDIVYLLAGSAIILTCFYFIVSPFFTTNESGMSIEEEAEENLTLESVYGAVNELEMDYLMKKMNEQDFLQLKQQYQLLATELLSQENNLKKDRLNTDAEEAELELLRELQKLRKQKG